MRELAAFGIAAFLAITSPSPGTAEELTGAAAVTGAGSTFAYPLVAEWSKGYQRWVAGGSEFPVAGGGLDDPPPRQMLDYEPVGSLAGIMRAKDGSVDFGASDMPLTSQELQKQELVQFPVVIGGIVAVVNLDGVGPGQIKFNGEVLADVFLGKIERWNDPAIAALNPELELPDAKIAVIHRSDGSGTTFNFTDYLSKVSAPWRDSVGSDLLVKWPTGLGAKGNEGVAEAVAGTKNSIGYVEYAQALRSDLAYALLRNTAGAFVSPGAASFQAAAANADWAGAGDFHLLLTNTPGEKAYPIVATVFVLIHKSITPGRARATLNFFEWALDKGQRDAAELGYVPLPEVLVTQVKAYCAKNLRPGS